MQKETAFQEYLRAHRARFESELEALLRIPSVSTDPGRRDDVRAAAQWLAERLRRLRMARVEMMETGASDGGQATGGPPVVFAESEAVPGAPTVLVYGHYDVQPPEPLELWSGGPFEPVRRGENLYARGASDMKGSLLAVLQATEALQETGGLPVQVKFLLEGEEEIGSPHLLDFLRRNGERFRADLCLNPDGGMAGPGLPAIIYGLRGLAYFDLRVSGPARDLHSGQFGGAVHNPAQALAELIAALHDGRGRVTLPGFYERVRPLSDGERRALARLPLDDEHYRQGTGVPALWGEEGFSSLERIGARPTLEVNGLLAGFTGEGAKTVIPSTALAKISTRLVPDQDPLEVEKQLRGWLEERAPGTVRWELKRISAAPPSLTDLDVPGVRMLASALQQVWGREPVYQRSGGSIPVVAWLQQELGLRSVVTGFSLPDDNAHSPDEKLHLPTWHRGQEAVGLFLLKLSAG